MAFLLGWYFQTAHAPEQIVDPLVDLRFLARQNLDGSARYLAMMLESFGDPHLALAASCKIGRDGKFGPNTMMLEYRTERLLPLDEILTLLDKVGVHLEKFADSDGLVQELAI